MGRKLHSRGLGPKLEGNLVQIPSKTEDRC